MDCHRFLMHQPRERRGALRRRSEKRPQSTVPDVLGRGAQADLRTFPPAVSDRLELAHQRMRRIDFVVPVRADQHQVRHVRPGQQILEEIERRRVEPLQVVEEERQRMFGPREYADEPPEDQLETALRVLGRKLRDRRLFSDDELQLGNEVHHEPPFGPSASRSASRQCAVRPRSSPEATGQALKGLRERRIRDVALVLVELAGCEKAARRNKRLVQLIDDGGLADPGIAGNQHQLRRAAR